VVGSGRLTETLVHQQASLFISDLGSLYANLSPADIWFAVSLFQMDFDRQDSHNHAAFLYRNPLNIAGTTRKASILLSEGLDDSLVPNHASESLAWTLGPIPHLQPIQRPVPFLAPATGPLTANVDAETTAAFFQFVPVGVPGIPPTPGCAALPPSSGGEGHYCAQSAAEARQQRVLFLESALSQPVPTITNPFGG